MKTRSVWRAVVAAVALVGLAGCDFNLHRLDAIAIAELKACGDAPVPGEVVPPPGTYVDQGIALDYDALAPRSKPFDGDSAALARLWTDERWLEQLYYDAATGHLRAGHLVCGSEVGVAWTARELARRMAKPDCGTLRTCVADYDSLQLSRTNASGVRVLGIVKDSFEAEAARIGLAKQVVAELGALVAVSGGVMRLAARSRMPRAGARMPRAAGARMPRVRGPGAAAAKGSRPGSPGTVTRAATSRPTLRAFSRVETRTTLHGERGVRLTRPDGSVLDITAERVKEYAPVIHPNAPPGTMQRVKFPNAQPRSKGYKRDPTSEELRLLEEAFK